MAQITAKYGDQRGVVVETKDSLKWHEFMAIGKTIQQQHNDTTAANDALIKMGIKSITTTQGNVVTEPLAIIKAFGELDARDGRKVIEQINKLIATDSDDDPKESENS